MSRYLLNWTPVPNRSRPMVQCIDAGRTVAYFHSMRAAVAWCEEQTR